MSREIVFEDDNVRVIYRKGRSDRLLITFADLVTQLDGTRFFADVPVEKLDLAAVGFVAKAGNWFPASSIAAAAEALKPLLASFAGITIYGGSMGGYGAIKYSRLLGADLVIALCPQWSLDASECDGFNPRWQSYYRPFMAGMGIRAQDVGGRIFLLADMGHALDRSHAGQIQRAAPDLHIVNTPSTGHHVTTVMAGTANLSHLMAACLAQDVGAIRPLVRTSRRYHRYRLETLVERMQHSHPGLLHAGLRRWIAAGPLYRDGMSPDMLDSLAACCRTVGDRHLESVVLAARCGVEADPARQVLLALRHALLTDGATGIITHHGTSLLFDTESGEVRHGMMGDDGRHIPLRYHVSGRSIRFRVEGGGMTLDLSAATSGTRAGRFRPGDQGLSGELVPAGPGAFAVRVGDNYLSADSRGGLTANRQKAQAWETFRFLS